MKIAIIGAGYVGLVTGVSLALLGHDVFCVESNKERVSDINRGKSPFFEPGIDEHLKRALDSGLLRATDDFNQSVEEAEIVYIAVGTPTVDNKIDLTFIKNAAEQLGEAIKKTEKYQVVVVKSTVLPGVTETVVKPIIEKFSNKKVGEFGLCMNPEFLREGSALEDALNPDRVVIGQFDERSGKEFSKVYEKLSCPIIYTNLGTAEMTKYASNALLATLISFANEISRISEQAGEIDVLDVWKGVHLDKRLSPIVGGVRVKPGILSYIMSGCGYGGSCFPKDTQALVSFADEIGAQADLIKSVIQINKTQPQRTILLLKKAIGEELRGKKIAVLGLTFKPNTDDMRESAAFPIINQLISEGVVVICHDPKAYKECTPKALEELDITLAESVQEALEGADGVIVVTAWDEYVNLEPNFFKQYMKEPVLIDGRRIYNKSKFLSAGVIYKGIGS